MLEREVWPRQNQYFPRNITKLTRAKAQQPLRLKCPRVMVRFPNSEGRVSSTGLFMLDGTKQWETAFAFRIWCICL